MTAPNAPRIPSPRPSVEQLIKLQNALMAVRDQLDRDGAEHAFGLTRVDIALISWALGLAHGYCLHNDRLDEREKALCTHPDIFVGPDGICKSCGSKP